MAARAAATEVAATAEVAMAVAEEVEGAVVKAAEEEAATVVAAKVEAVEAVAKAEEAMEVAVAVMVEALVVALNLDWPSMHDGQQPAVVDERSMCAGAAAAVPANC